jgi:hypothetical protein
VDTQTPTLPLDAALDVAQLPATRIRRLACLRLRDLALLLALLMLAWMARDAILSDDTMPVLEDAVIASLFCIAAGVFQLRSLGR